MDTVVNDFVGVLRDHHLRISPAESIDALNALKHTGIGERKSDMPLCDRVEVVRTIDQLAGVAEELVKVRA